MVDHTKAAWRLIRKAITRKRLKQLVSLLGATIILGTFIAKDARKDKLKELMASIEDEENTYISRRDGERTLNRLMTFERTLNSITNHLGAVSSDADNEGCAVVKDAAIRYDEAKDLSRNVARLADTLSLEGPDATLLSVLSESQKRASAIDELSSTCGGLMSGSEGHVSAKDADKAARVVRLYALSADAVGGILRDDADKQLTTYQHDYATWTTIYYYLFALGWLVTLAGIMLGEPEEKTVVEEIAGG